MGDLIRLADRRPLLDRRDLEQLAAWLDVDGETGWHCQGTLEMTRAWAVERRLDHEAVLGFLDRFGEATCDCATARNVAQALQAAPGRPA